QHHLNRMNLSGREKEILHYIIKGKSNKEIAGILDLSTGTVRNYISNMFRKYHFQSRTELAVYFTSTDTRTEDAEDDN
ncbi:MAG TPA: helix-turn-helix transcriptional regulator, partial [Bacilli bacterium]